MLDAEVIERDARNIMMDWPVTIRHYYNPAVPTAYHQVNAGFSRGDESWALMPGALLDDFNCSIVYMTDDLNPRPINLDLIDIQMRDGSWLTFQVNRTPDNTDPLAELTELGLGTPNA